jgi:hypothetical protein
MFTGSNRVWEADSVTYYNHHGFLRRGFYVTGVNDRIFTGPFPTEAAAEAALAEQMTRAGTASIDARR